MNTIMFFLYNNQLGNTKIICQYINSEQMDLKCFYYVSKHINKNGKVILLWIINFFLNWRIVDQTHSYMALLVVHGSERAHWTHDGMQEL